MKIWAQSDWNRFIYLFNGDILIDSDLYFKGFHFFLLQLWRLTINYFSHPSEPATHHLPIQNVISTVVPIGHTIGYLSISMPEETSQRKGS